MNEFLKRHAPAKIRRHKTKTYILKVQNHLTGEEFDVARFLTPGDCFRVVTLLNKDTDNKIRHYFAETV